MTWTPSLLGKWLATVVGMGLLLSGVFIVTFPQAPRSGDNTAYPGLYEGEYYTIYQNARGYGYYQGQFRQKGETSPDASYIIQKVFQLARGGAGRSSSRKGSTVSPGPW